MEKSQIKIAHVVCVVPPYGGGIGIAAHQQAEQMAERGYDVTVIAPLVIEKRKIERKYKIDQLWSIFKLGHGAIMPTLLWKLRKFDIVHLHFPFFGAAFVTALIKIFRRDKVKLVLTYHQDLILSGFRNWYYRFSMKFAIPLILKLADKIIVSSEDYVEYSYIQEFYQKNLGKFAEIGFGVPNRFNPEEKDEGLMKKYDFMPNDFIVTFVGGLDWAHYFKGVNYLIKAIDLIDNKKIKALIIGTGNLLKQYKEQVRELGLESRVKFAGYVSDEDLPKHYNLSEIFILPSINKNEAFGIVLIEALACGKPLIASNLKGVRAVVDSGRNGLLTEPKNSRDIAAKILYLYENPTVMKRFRKNAIKTANEKYRLNIIGDKLEHLYLKLLKKNHD